MEHSAADIKKALIELRTARYGRAISQSEMAELIGKSLASVQKYERLDAPLPPIDVIAQYCVLARSVDAEDLASLFRDVVVEQMDQTVLAALFSAKMDIPAQTTERSVEDIFTTSITVPRRYAAILKAVAEFLDSEKTEMEQLMADQIISFANLRLSKNKVSDNQERKPNGTHL